MDKSPKNEKKEERIDRNCLCCGKPFKAKGKFNRICSAHCTGSTYMSEGSSTGNMKDSG